MTDKQIAIQELYTGMRASTYISATAANDYAGRLGLSYEWEVPVYDENGVYVSGSKSVGMREIIDKYNEEQAIINA